MNRKKNTKTKSQSCILIQANGNNERLGKFFKQPKHELFFGKKRIIEKIIYECKKLKKDIFISLREGSEVNFNLSGCNVIRCSQTFNRIDTLEQCMPHLKSYDSILILDSDVIIKAEVLKLLKHNSIAVGQHPRDGKKYGFIDVDPSFNYITGNEKEKESSHISIGAYSVDSQLFLKYLKSKTGRENESLLNYYNKHNPSDLFFSDSHIVLGDINSYMNQLKN